MDARSRCCRYKHSGKVVFAAGMHHTCIVRTASSAVHAAGMDRVEAACAVQCNRFYNTTRDDMALPSTQSLTWGEGLRRRISSVRHAPWMWLQSMGKGLYDTLRKWKPAFPHPQPATTHCDIRTTLYQPAALTSICAPYTTLLHPASAPANLVQRLNLLIVGQPAVVQAVHGMADGAVLLQH